MVASTQDAIVAGSAVAIVGVVAAGIYFLYEYLKGNPQANPLNPNNFTTGAFSNPFSQLGRRLQFFHSFRRIIKVQT